MIMVKEKEVMVPVKLPVAKPAVMTHTIVAGDNLAKIAKQYYGSAKNSDIQKIVAANPGTLKDANTILVVTKKLVIPGVAAAARPPVATVATPGQVRALAKPAGNSVDGVMVYLPSTSMKESTPPAIGGPIAPKTDANKKDAPKADNKDTGKKTYVVQSGDTLEKIARKLAPSKSSEMVQKLIALNGIKDPSKLQAGSPLKVPA